MPKKSLANKNSVIQNSSNTLKKSDNVYLDKHGNIMIKILAKPGSKCNAVTDIIDEGICVQINAPPVDGEANSEIIKYLSSILQVKKNELSLDRGSKSRQKIIQVFAGISTVEEIKSKLQDAARK